MKTFQYIIIAAAAILPLLFTSCIKDDLYTTPHPDKGALMVSPDFSKHTEGVALPQEYVLSVGGNECNAPASQAFCYPELLTPAEYRTMAYNIPEGVTATDNKASVNRLADGTFTAMPGYLFTYSAPVTIVADDTVKVDMPMTQRMRDLYIKLTVTEGDVERVAAVKGSITGIAGEFDILHGTTAGDAGSVTPAFTVTGTTVVAHTRLLGTTGDRQTLTLDITFNDGRSQTVNSDITQLLKDFNADMTTPTEIHGNLLLPIAAGFDITITDLKTDEVENVDLY